MAVTGARVIRAGRDRGIQGSGPAGTGGSVWQGLRGWGSLEHRVHPGAPRCLRGAHVPAPRSLPAGCTLTPWGPSPGHMDAHVPAAQVHPGAMWSRVPTSRGPSMPPGAEERRGLFLGCGVAAVRQCQGALRHGGGWALPPRHRSHSSQRTGSSGTARHSTADPPAYRQGEVKPSPSHGAPHARDWGSPARGAAGCLHCQAAITGAIPGQGTPHCG